MLIHTYGRERGDSTSVKCLVSINSCAEGEEINNPPACRMKQLLPPMLGPVTTRARVPSRLRCTELGTNILPPDSVASRMGCRPSVIFK